MLVGGSAQQIASVRARATQLGIGERVVLTGQRPRRRKCPSGWRSATMLVSPRLHGSNTPLKLFSYMWSAVPIVATDLPTHTQVLSAREAVLRPATAEGLASGMLRRARAIRLATHRSAPPHVRASTRDYSRDAFRRKLLAAYDLIGTGVRSSVATSM